MYTKQNRRGLNRPISRPLWLMTSAAADVISVPGVISPKIYFSFQDGMNYALFRPANQSTTFRRHNGASIAVDGSIDGDAYSHTNYGDYHPWWKVKLAYPIWVTHVEITNREDMGEQIMENNFMKIFS